MTQDRLKELMEYDMITGIAKRLKTISGVKSGAINGMHNKGYKRVSFDGQRDMLHRYIWLFMTGSFPEEFIDHIDGDRCNNSWSNLRAVSNQENCMNRRISKNNTSGHTGVYWHSRDKIWEAKIKVNQKFINLGSFIEIEDAIEARKKAESQYNFHENHGRKG